MVSLSSEVRGTVASKHWSLCFSIPLTSLPCLSTFPAYPSLISRAFNLSLHVARDLHLVWLQLFSWPDTRPLPPLEISQGGESHSKTSCCEMPTNSKDGWGERANPKGQGKKSRDSKLIKASAFTCQSLCSKEPKFRFPQSWGTRWHFWLDREGKVVGGKWKALSSAGSAFEVRRLV